MCLPLLILSIAMPPALAAAASATSSAPTSQGLTWGVDPAYGHLTNMESFDQGRRRRWLTGPVNVSIRNEVSGVEAPLAKWTRRTESDVAIGSAVADSLKVRVQQRLCSRPGGMVWDLDLESTAPRVGHEVTVELPLPATDLRLFTPTEYGVVRLATHPRLKPVAYGSLGWDTGRSYVLPLVSVLDERNDLGLTIALPPDRNIPHMQVQWTEARVLKLTFAHRGIGLAADQPRTEPTRLTLLVYAHAADYRAALRAYSEEFPAYFRPVAKLAPYDGAFYYHHIHEHPDFDEMARQNVRYLWSSFWFTHLGEYLPDEPEWHPYTYAKWWKLGQTMSDSKIRSFVRTMHEHGIATFAYFNVTEYGGAGGKGGDTATAQRILKEKFADALMKDASLKDIPTWEGAMAMNAGRRYALWPFLVDQVRRHLQRLPEIDGFAIDRLDWASLYDYGHHDGLSMIGDRAVENMAVPVAEAVREVCRLSHAAGKRVLVNQFYRIEVLRDVDGYCHENDYLRAIGYLSPYRPASAWHMRKPYQGDLLAFEAQLKQRLQFALQPQMIAHTFPISQQAPNSRAAELLEIYAPLFTLLAGKQQVLLPHCVSVTGDNDVNLFINGNGCYVAPVTSRIRFLSRRSNWASTATVTLRVPDGESLTWAHVYSADNEPRRASIGGRGPTRQIMLDDHRTASMVLIGRGAEPPLNHRDTKRIAETRERLFPKPARAAKTVPPIAPAGLAQATLVLKGTHVGIPGPVLVQVDSRMAGQIPTGQDRCEIALDAQEVSDAPPTVRLSYGDEGTWLVPDRIDLVQKAADGSRCRIGRWLIHEADTSLSDANDVLRLQWCAPEPIVSMVRFEGRDTRSGGAWKGTRGALAAWIPAVTDVHATCSGCRLSVPGAQTCVWAQQVRDDPRVLHPPADTAGPRAATCWFADEKVSLRIEPPDTKPFRLSVYLLDYDRNQRASEVRIGNDAASLSVQRATVQEMLGGVWLTWTVAGETAIEVKKTAGYNAVLSGVFIDRP